jgi:hypothetical protein
MDIALPRSRWRERPEGIRSLENWLLCWILLPNAAYWLLWIVGGPPRPQAVIVTGFIGILVHRAPFAVKFAAFLVAMAASAFFFISALFNLSILSLLHALQFATELNPSASVEYLVCGAAVAATILAAWRLLRRPTVLTEPTRFGAAGAVTLLAAWFDVAFVQSDAGSYMRTPETGAPFASAVDRSGLERIANGERHVLVVMVEAMGQPTDPALRQRLTDLWARPEVRARYEVSSGETLFYGSTTSGEMRELCGRWGDYDQVMERADPACLPARLASRGYHSQAWHSFNGSFFNRTSWYPNIGFAEMRFWPELRDGGAERCPGVFSGACDRDVPRQIGAALKAARQPQFLYWLTVNSHLPVLRSKRLQTETCDRFDPTLDRESPMTCRLLQLFDQTGRALAREIVAADFPAADILIVGDHIPPFFDRHHRSQFEPDRVPWILLRPRDPAADLRLAVAR